MINDLLETHWITPRLMNKKQGSLNRQSFKIGHKTVLKFGKCQILNSCSNCIRWIPLGWEINSIFFYRFCSLFSTQWNEGFYHPCILRTQNTKKSFFKFVTFFCTRLFLYHKESFAAHQTFCDNFIINEIDNKQFYR